VNFQNEPTATAPAQTVTVTDQLDPNLDWTTFQIGDLGFGNTTVSVPAGRTSFHSRVDATATLGVYVDINASLNLQTGLVTWTFTSLDPTTLDLPMDPLAGFLPPDKNPPLGEGFVTYIVRPKPALVTGTKINAQATVVFDTNPPINTAQLFNTVDSAPPTSKVTALPATENTTQFLVKWSGQDDAGGSGVANFTIYVSDNGGAFVPWLQNTTLTQASYTGQQGHTYAFYSQAADNVGNVEPAHTTTDTQTTVSNNATNPASQFLVSPPASVTAGTSFTITVSAQDGNHNVVTSYPGTIHFASSDPLAVLPADYTFQAGDNGVHTFTVTLKTAGSQTVSATDTVTGSITGTGTVPVNAAAAVRFSVVSSVASGTSGTPFTLTVTSLDTFGNTATGYAGTVKFTSSDKKAILPMNYAFLSSDHGMHVFTNGVTLKTAGNQSVAATDTVNSAITGQVMTTSEFGTAASTSTPTGVAAGPDGNVWFTESALGNIGQITPSGQLTEFPVPTPDSEPTSIAKGPDGNLWFTEYLGNRIGFITPSGQITELPVLTAGSNPLGITSGPDGNLWFTESARDRIGRITPAGVLTEFALTTDSVPQGIIAGPDGNLWFTETGRNRIGRLTTAGTLKEFALASGRVPEGITVGPDKSLWFIEAGGNRIGRITTTGVISEFAVPTANSGVTGITSGPDKNLWFTESTANQLARITTKGVVTEFPLSTPGSSPDGIITGPDNNLWFAESGAGKVGRLQLTLPVVPGPVAKFLVTAPAATVAGASFTIKVTAEDAAGNTVTGYTGAIHFTSTDVRAVLPANYTFVSSDSGVHSFTVTLKTVGKGTQTTTVTDTTTSSIKGVSSSVKVSPAAFDHFLVSAPSSTVAGSLFTITVTAQDIYNNTVTTYTGTVRFSSSDPQAVLPANYTFTTTDKGVHVFTNLAALKTVGITGLQTITATDSATGTASGTATVKVSPAAASTLMISAPSLVNVGASFTFTVTAVDAYGNIATGYRGRISFSSSDTAASLPGPYTFTAADGGVHTFSATLNNTGTQSLTGTDSATPGITGTDPTIEVASALADLPTGEGDPDESDDSHGLFVPGDSRLPADELARLFEALGAAGPVTSDAMTGELLEALAWEGGHQGAVGTLTWGKHLPQVFWDAAAAARAGSFGVPDTELLAASMVAAWAFSGLPAAPDARPRRNALKSHSVGCAARA
jgi:streptogramin lyase